jgi:energy-coupling factor transporter ATP-binding protein EcfA2
MSAWDAYPRDYRAQEAQAIIAAVRAGECVSVVGLSGAGKSNLLGFLAHRLSTPEHPLVLVDGNRLAAHTPAAFFQLMRRALGDQDDSPDELSALEAILTRRLSESGSSLCLLLDRFEALTALPDPAASGNLRALRDAHKYSLTLVTATRRPLDQHTELAELFYAHTLWLGPLSESDAHWNVARHAERSGLKWGDETAQALISVSRGYPSLLRAACEAHADGTRLEVDPLLSHPAVRARVEEFWADQPSDADLRHSGLDGHPLLLAGRPPAAAIGAPAFDTSRLTAKEHLLFSYLARHTGVVCEKDDLIRAVWPEDRVFEKGVRDDSLAQLVRRLREKIEPDPSNPRYIHTVPGRGYRFTSG